jgi:uncharacterized protein (TIRG00374 family)
MNETNPEDRINSAWTVSRSRIARGIKLFIALTMVGMFIIIYRSSFGASIAYLRDFSLIHLLIILALLLMDWTLGGARIYIFARRIQPDYPYLACLKANLANIFMGGVTPSQTGGGAGQIYVLYREGMGGVDATVISFLGFINTALFLPICGIVITLFIGAKPGNIAFRYFSVTTMLLFGTIIFLVVFSLFDPKRFERGVHRFLRVLPVIGKRIDGSKALQKIFETFLRYHALMLYFIKRGKLVFATAFIITVIVYFSKFLVAYLVVDGLGIEADFFQVMYLQLIIFLIFYFAPTPGASGLAEVSSALIMGQVIPKSYEGIFVLLWRFFTLFLGMIVGGFVMVRYLVKSDREG